MLEVLVNNKEQWDLLFSREILWAVEKQLQVKKEVTHYMIREFGTQLFPGLSSPS